MAVGGGRDWGLAARIAGASVLVALANVAFVSLVVLLASYVATLLLVFDLYTASTLDVLLVVAAPSNWRSPVVLPATAAFLLGQYLYATRRPAGGVDAAAAADDRLAGRVRRLAKQAGVPTPDAVVADAPEANSYTVGRRGNATVVVTRPLLDALDDDELDAVLAHELAHVANRDVTVMTVAATPFRLARRLSAATDRLVYLAGVGLFVFWHVVVGLMIVGMVVGLLTRELVGLLPVETVVEIPGSDVAFWVADRTGWVVKILGAPVMGFLLSVMLFALVPLFATGAYRVLLDPLPRLLARYREFAADRGAARMTGDPAALASALETLDEDRRPAADARAVRAVAALCLHPGGVGSDPIRGPIRAAIADRCPGVDAALDRLSGSLVAHPETADRIERLRAVGHD